MTAEAVAERAGDRPRRWQPWPTWDAAAGKPGPLHGPRRDLPGGGKAIPWQTGSKPSELVYFAGPGNVPPELGARVVLCEGEKTADAVAAAGYLAAATVCGAASDPTDAVVELLARYRIVLAPDADDLGRKHMTRLSARLERAGVDRLWWIEPPEDAPKGWDLADCDAETRRAAIEQARELPLLGPEELEAQSPGTDRAPGPEPKPERGSAATRLVELALASGAVLGHDGRGRSWVRLPSRELLTFADGGVSAWLRRLAFDDTRRSLPSDTVAEARDTLDARAQYAGVMEPVYVRVAPLPEGGLALDLGRPDWTAAVVRASGWSVEPHPVNFTRPTTAAALPVPVRGGCLDDLGQLLNLGQGDDAQRRLRLVAGWMVSAMRPTGPYLALAFAGPAGSAKSHTAKVLRQLLDPTARGGGGGVMSLPRSEDAFASAVGPAWLPVFDNLSGTTGEQADWLAQLATGYANTRRTMYQNDGTYIREACRPFILTGIDLTDRDDLMSRLLVVRLPALDAGYTTEGALYEQLDRQAPALLGALLDALVSAVRVQPTLPTTGWPARMADAARWVTGAEPDLGWPSGWWAAALAEEQAAARGDLLADKPWYPPLVALLEDRGGSWSGTAGELLAALRRGIDDRPGEAFGWPKAARGMREQLDRHRDSLTAAGVRFEYRRAHGGVRTVDLSTRDSGASGSARASGMGDAGDGGDGRPPHVTTESWKGEGSGEKEEGGLVRETTVTTVTTGTTAWVGPSCPAGLFAAHASRHRRRSDGLWTCDACTDEPPTPADAPYGSAAASWLR